jgi:PEP-CTERM motif
LQNNYSGSLNGWRREGAMKRLFVHGIVFISLCVFAIPAWSYWIDTIDVGGVDTIIDKVDKDALGNSGDQGVLGFIQENLPDAIGFQKVSFNFQNVYSDSSNNVVVQNVYAALLPDDPANYIIKFGNLKITPVNYDIYLFQNNSSMNYAVIDLSGLGGDLSNINIDKVSYVGVVPEPSTLLLMGSGLLGLALYGRRRMKN